MARSDWRSAGAYDDLRPPDAPAFAYEFLRRNPQFLADHARLMHKSRKQVLEATEMEEFSKRWGVRFRQKIGYHPTRRRVVDATGASEHRDPDANS